MTEFRHTNLKHTWGSHFQFIHKHLKPSEDDRGCDDGDDGDDDDDFRNNLVRKIILITVQKNKKITAVTFPRPAYSHSGKGTLDTSGRVVW